MLSCISPLYICCEKYQPKSSFFLLFYLYSRRSPVFAISNPIYFETDHQLSTSSHSRHGHDDLYPAVSTSGPQRVSHILSWGSHVELTPTPPVRLMCISGPFMKLSTSCRLMKIYNWGMRSRRTRGMCGRFPRVLGRWSPCQFLGVRAKWEGKPETNAYAQ